jgi:hypothetical protein
VHYIYEQVRSHCCAVGNEPDTIDEWEKAEDDEKERYIQFAEHKPDPRLQPRIHVLRSAEVAFRKSLPGEERDYFFYFAVQLKAMNRNELSGMSLPSFLSSARTY